MSIIKSIKTKSKGGSSITATLDDQNNIRVFLAGDGCEGTHTLTADDKKALMVKFDKAPRIQPRAVARNTSYRAGYGGGRA